MRATAILPLLATGLLISSTACGDSVTLIECQPGTRPEGDKCVPISDDADTTSPDTMPVDTAQPPRDTGVAETSAPDSSPADTRPADTVADTAGPRGVGGPCVKNADCLGGTCLDWPDGYCTALDCDTGANACPAGSSCMVVQGGNQACLADCTLQGGECRASGQACKRVADAQTGALRDVCHGVAVDAAGTGSACAAAADCLGADVCLSAFPGGYCARLGCDETPCQAGSSCVRVNGSPTCLLSCQADGDCGSSPGAERKCGTLNRVGGGTAKVCISGVDGKAMGELCLSDFECDSGTCQILGEGRCSQTNAPCFQSSALTDCNGAEFCFVSGSNGVGICTQPCGPGASCGGSSFCLSDSGDFSNDAGFCRPSCDGPGGSVGCSADAGLECRFGVPIGAGGQGRYACALSVPRGFGASCGGASDCASGECTTSASAGFCAVACGDDDSCPFGGACVSPGGGAGSCQRMCFSAADCASGFDCGLAAGALRTVCTP